MPGGAPAWESPPPVQPAADIYRPVQEAQRIAALDVLRGFAVLGIFVVNIASFSMPLFEALYPQDLHAKPLTEKLAWAAVKVFAEFKFVSLFSLLFGAGFAIQMMRAQHAGRDLVPLYLRRIALLALVGIVHGFFIWYGDILLMYAIAALFLLPLARVKTRTLLALAAAAFLLGALLWGGFTALGLLAEDWKFQANSSVEAPSHEPGTDFQRWWRVFRASGFDPEHPRWAEAETMAYRDGPWAAAQITRSVTFLMSLLFSFGLSGFGLRIVGLFLLGSALMRLGFFASERRTWHPWSFAVGMLVGLPLELAVAGCYWAEGVNSSALCAAGEVIHYFSSLMLMFGYTSGVCLLVFNGALPRLTAGLAAVGRMALTHYLLQSIVATAIMYWWGLGLFGQVPRVWQLAMVAAIFVCQCLLSLLWLRVFAAGPLEWLWRSLTYARLQPLLRTGSGRM